VLGLARSLTVSRERLEAVFLEASRAVHPDRHATADATVRRHSMEASAAVNRAYRTLRAPSTRGRYWLELHGEPLAANNNRVPPALAELVFETQEQLEAFRARRTDVALRAAVERVHADLAAEVRRRLEELEGRYAEWDRADSASQDVLRELKARLSEIAYLETLVGDVDEALEG
jgi:molecular chaperone HscB